jgi:CO/xanthine dehydrogenase Mo-binding subunit
MLTYSTFIQEEQSAARHISQLETRLREIGNEFLGVDQESVTFKWTPVATGRGFTAGAPSKSSLIAAVVSDGIQDAIREKMLAAICTAWTEETGCTLSDVMATVMEAGHLTSGNDVEKRGE